MKEDRRHPAEQLSFDHPLDNEPSLSTGTPSSSAAGA